VLLGIVGLPGSGKTSLSSILEDNGATVLSGDEVGHQIVHEDLGVREELLAAFGSRILSADGSVSRPQLAAAALSGPNSLEVLNRIVHPRLLRRLSLDVAEAERKAVSSSAVVAVDAALIPEWGIDHFFDLVVYVYCPLEERQKRLTSSGKDVRILKRLEAAQFSERDKRKRCHVVVDNDGTMDELVYRGRVLCEAISGLYGKKGRTGSCQRKLWAE